MQHYKIKTSDWVCAAASFFVSSTVHAAIPPINITLSSGAGSNIIAIGPGQTATVEYLIQDVIGRPPARTWLWTDPIPAYMSRTASLHQPDCSVYNQNPAIPNSFVLPPNGSCYFAMEVNGTILANQGAPTTYKPIFSNSAAVAYGPCDPLQLTPTPTPPPPVIPGLLLSAGSYIDSSAIQRPFLVSSRDEGVTWVYPDAIPSVPNPPIHFIELGSINGTSCTGATCIAAGVGEDGTFHTFPLLAVSQDSALTWNYIPSMSSPVFTPDNTLNPYVTDGTLTSASCNGNICIAGGQYESTNSNRPLLAVSQDKGVTFIYPSSITEPEFTPDNTINPYADAGIFNSVSCSSALCIAVGSYFDEALITRPFAALSQNGGGTWIYPTSVTEVVFTPPPSDPNMDFQNGNLFGASCSGNNCVAAGAYVDIGNTTRPLIVVTNDAGNTWTYPGDVIDPSVTPTFSFGFFNSVSCSATTCVAAGNYTGVLFDSHPLLAVSQNAGISWSFPANISIPVFTPVDTNPFSAGYFNSTSCSRDLCIAVGAYTDTNTVTRPLLALSQDGGTTWTYPEVITAPVFEPVNSNPFSATGVFNAASCDGSTCIASGSYVSNSVQRPLIALTKDAGVTWTYPDAVTSPVFTPVNTFPFDNTGLFHTATTTSPSFLPERLQFLYEKKRL